MHLLILSIALLFSLPAPTWADEILDWNKILFQAALTGGTSPLNTTRVAAIMQSAVFDAVNGIERRYTPIHVEPAAPRGASKRAAAVQAAYATLVSLYASQKTTFLDPKRAESLAAIANNSAVEDSVSIAQGIEWGQAVADAILAWRATDGFSTVLPAFTGGLAAGQWRPTPPANLPGVGLQYVTMTTWVINSPGTYRPLGPPALTSALYTTVFNEVKTMGSIGSASRTADETLYSQFWNVSTAPQYWDQITRTLAVDHHLPFSENSRLLALVNLAMADAAIGCWEAKYYPAFVVWRPITAIRLASTDGNSATDQDATWSPLLTTPAHPEYPSGHSCVSGAAGRVLANYLGDDVPFTVSTDVVTAAVPLGTTRSFSSLTQALQEIKNARIFAGIHFRTACDDGQLLGIAVADDVFAHALQPVNGQHKGQLRH
jgi:hypothetical protein